MPFLRRVLLAALFAGALSGGFAGLLHQFATVPLILEAEKYEHAAGHAAEHAAPPADPANSPAAMVVALSPAAELLHSHRWVRM